MKDHQGHYHDPSCRECEEASVRLVDGLCPACWGERDAAFWASLAIAAESDPARTGGSL